MARSPATTWALVTTVSAAMEKPLPSWMRLHAWPDTFTVAAPTRLSVAADRPVDAGGGPVTGEGRRASNTRGKPFAPTSRRSVWSVSGGPGRWASRNLAMLEFRAARADAPGTSAMAGSSSHTATRTPRAPTTAPTARSAPSIAPLGMTRPTIDPSTSPRAWPANAPPITTTAAINSLFVGSGLLNARRIVGSSRTATKMPSASPTHDATRARKPIR